MKRTMSTLAFVLRSWPSAYFSPYLAVLWPPRPWVRSRELKTKHKSAAPTQSGTPVHMDDEIRTGAKARLEVTFRDQTLLTLGENAKVVIDRYVFNPSQSSGEMAVKATRGAMRFVTGKIGKMKNHNVTVVTPQAALAYAEPAFGSARLTGNMAYCS